MACFETFVSLKRKIEQSNYDSANRNSNLYIVEEQASIEEIYEHYQCPCAAHCTCKWHGCGYHWRLKVGVSFEQFRDAYLRMFVHRHFHRHVIECLAARESPAGRAGKSVPFLLAAQSAWSSWSYEANATGATLLCDTWRTPFWMDLWSVWHNSVYWAKVWAMLLPDLAVPYDSGSLVKLRDCTKNAPPPYVELLARVRDELIALLSREHKAVKDLRQLDAPGASGAMFDSARISLRRPGFSYGKSFAPVERHCHASSTSASTLRRKESCSRSQALPSRGARAPTGH